MSGAALLLYARGAVAATGPLTALAHVPLVAALGAACFWALVSKKRLPRAAAGFAPPRPRDLAVALAFAGLGVVGGGAPALLAIAVGVAHIDPAHAATPPLLVLTGAAVLLGSAALQQLTLQSIHLALSRDGRPSALGVGVALLVFLAAHVDDRAGAVLLSNVLLFGALCILAFFLDVTRPAYAAPIAMHAAWNFALVYFAGVPGQEAIGIVRVACDDAALCGGAAGLEGGLLYTGVAASVAAGVVAVVVVVGSRRRRRVG